MRSEVRSLRLMALPPELYQHIFFHLTIPDLLRAAQVSRLFYQIAQGCLVNETYITPWKLAFNEEGYSRRIIPLDLEATRQELSSETGLYVFTSKIRPISCTYDYAEALHDPLKVSTKSFGLRFLGFNDIGSLLLRSTEINLLRYKSRNLHSNRNDVANSALRRIH